MNGKLDFDPDYVSPRQDPLAQQHVDGTKEIHRAFDESPTDSDRENVVEFVRAVFARVAGIDIDGRSAQLMIGGRFAALCWVVSPKFSDGASAAKLASRLGIKSVSKFLRLLGEASRKLGLTNRGQAYGWNRGHHGGNHAT